MNEINENPQHASEPRLSKRERHEFKKQRKEEERGRELRKRAMKKAMNIALVILVAGGVIFGLGWFISNQPNLPPTTVQGHIESSPDNHISSNPIADNIQRHMLEHADGRGKPGIIIQYNCKKYQCESDLVEKLTTLAREYPDNVYLAPNNYDSKIILTRLGAIKILDDFDELTIKNFIR